MIEVLTRKAEAERLEAAGITGEAAAIMLKATAPKRHVSRCEGVMALLQELIPCGGPTGRSSTRMLLEQWAELALDAVGYGGVCGYSGAATVRCGVMSRMGKGRKQATDGPAWTAARDDVMYQLARERREVPNGIREARPHLVPGTASVFVAGFMGENGPQVSAILSLDQWDVLRVAGAYLLYASGVEGVAGGLACNIFGHAEESETVAWSQLYNATKAAIAARAVALEVGIVADDEYREMESRMP